MDYIQVVILSLIQGLTEFLPISSSAHLILAPKLFGWADQGLAFDVAVHLGTLVAVMVYFRERISRMIVAWFSSLKGDMTADGKLAWGVIIGTIPAGLAGLAFKDFIELELRSELVIAASTVIFGLLLGYADFTLKGGKSEKEMGWMDFFWIGCAQALALIPGTSRSGSTMTAGMLLGFSREAAANFSFLLSIPIIVLSSLFVTKDLVESQIPVDWVVLGVGTVLSFISALACIVLFLKWIQKSSMMPFVIYRLALGGYLFWVFN